VGVAEPVDRGGVDAVVESARVLSCREDKPGTELVADSSRRCRRPARSSTDVGDRALTSKARRRRTSRSVGQLRGCRECAIARPLERPRRPRTIPVDR
jgi:hypothetical protein